MSTKMKVPVVSSGGALNVAGGYGGGARGLSLRHNT